MLYNMRSEKTDVPGSSHNFFTGTFGATSNAADSQPDNAQPDPHGVFADVFDEVCLHLYVSDKVIRSRLVTTT